VTASMSVLLVEDNPADARLVQEMLREAAPGTEVTWVTSARDACDQLARADGSVLLDLGLPDARGLQALEALREANDAVPIVIISGDTDEQLAIQAVAAGAQDYLLKGKVDAALLGRSLRYAVTRHRAEQLLADQARVLELIAAGSPLGHVLESIAHLVEDRCDQVACVVMVADEDESTLRVAAAPALDETLARALDGMPMGEGGPTPGVAAARGKPTATRDVGSEPGWAGRADALLAGGYPACWAAPVAARRDEAMLGALVLHLAEAREPTPDERLLADLATSLAAIAIEHDRFELRLEYQAVHDPLTALPNRTLFLDRLGQALARNRRDRSALAVLFCDLDRFKLINDSRGHPAGDRLLARVARRLLHGVRPGDTVARFGGDEFAILCEVVGGEADATTVAQRLIDLLAAPIPLDESEVHLGASIGIAFSGPDGPDAETLLQQADAAMYRAKAQGRGRWLVFDESMSAQAAARLDTELALRGALDDSRLAVFYQPQVSLDGGRVVGAEALVRWDDPARGIVLPDAFIPLAEETDLILAIGASVLTEACRAAAGWARQDGAAPVVSVNVSPRQLANPRLVTTVEQALEDAALPASRLCLEVTETAFMVEADLARETLRDIRSLGVSIAIDDFGTGYSSLAHLQQLPVDIIKIDLSFVQRLGHGRQDEAIVAAVIHLATDLGLGVVAEGVETPEQHAHLQRLGCPVGQGFLFGQAVPGEAFAASLS